MKAKFTVEVEGRVVTMTDLEHDLQTDSKWPEGVKHEEEALYRHIGHFLKLRERYIAEVVDKGLNTN